ncbi:oligosaccharide repeat unit polymerase [Geothermobacter hydrogeniphilus]|uniref:oligosaccharide repeat unit polymerase n=1 Tax=Geothermobacter hydrogeniphilus TaxID=1969733 RepID=UPI00111C24BB|nr:oligosaccharide repeat unit polymerase [Geothermobacter hydrogeniphilus]
MIDNIMLTLTLHFFVLLLSFVLFFADENGLCVVVFAIFSAIFELCLWASREKRNLSLNWCHPVPVFVFGYCVVYYQLPFCYISGFDLSHYSNQVIFAPHNISYCVLLAVIGLSSFFCGEQILYLRSNNDNFIKINVELGGNFESKNQRIMTVNNFVVFGSLLFFFFYIRSIGFYSYFGFSYGGATLPRGILSTHFRFAFMVLLYLAILLEIYRLVLAKPDTLCGYFSVWDKRVLAVIIVTLVPFVLSGDRGAYLQPLALVVAPYYVLVKPLRFSQAVAAAIILSLMLVVVGDTRGRSVTLKEAFINRVEAVSNPAKWPTIELANSFGTFNIATKYFPEYYSYNNGLNMLYRIASLVPFSSYFTEVEKKNKENDYIFISSLFFTNILTRGTFSSGSGTSSLADIYIDYGPYGIPIITFLWGVFMGFIGRKNSFTFSPVSVFLYAYYVYYSIYVNRSSFFFGWNIFVWVLILFYFIDKLYIDNLSVIDGRQ